MGRNEFEFTPAFIGAEDAIQWARETPPLQPWVAATLQDTAKAIEQIRLDLTELTELTAKTRKLLGLMTTTDSRGKEETEYAKDRSSFKPTDADNPDNQIRQTNPVHLLQTSVRLRNEGLRQLLRQLIYTLSPPVRVEDPKKVPPNPHLAIVTALGEYNIPALSPLISPIRKTSPPKERTPERGAENLALFIVSLLQYVYTDDLGHGKHTEADTKALRNLILELASEASETYTESGRPADSPLRRYINYFAVMDPTELEKLAKRLKDKGVLRIQKALIWQSRVEQSQVWHMNARRTLQTPPSREPTKLDIDIYLAALILNILNPDDTIPPMTRETRINILIKIINRLEPYLRPILPYPRAPLPLRTQYDKLPTPRRPVPYAQFIETLKAALQQANTEHQQTSPEDTAQSASTVGDTEVENEILRYYEVWQAILKIAFSLMNPKRAIWQNPGDIAKITRTTEDLPQKLKRLRRREERLLKRLKELQQLLLELQEIATTAKSRITEIREFIDSHSQPQAPFSVHP